jgi:hypothetical protein
VGVKGRKRIIKANTMSSMLTIHEKGFVIVPGGAAEEKPSEPAGPGLPDPIPLKQVWDGETVLTYLSHHVRTGAMVTLGFVELLEHTLSAEELDRLRFEDNHRGGPRTLRDVLGRIAKSQEKMVRMLESLEG